MAATVISLHFRTRHRRRPISNPPTLHFSSSSTPSDSTNAEDRNTPSSPPPPPPQSQSQSQWSSATSKPVLNRTLHINNNKFAIHFLLSPSLKPPPKPPLTKKYAKTSPSSGSATLHLIQLKIPLRSSSSHSQFRSFTSEGARIPRSKRVTKAAAVVITRLTPFARGYVR